MKNFFKKATAVLIAVAVLTAVLAAVVALEWATMNYVANFAKSEISYCAYMIALNAAYYIAACAIQKLI